MSDSGKIACELCGAEVHSIQVHLKKDHPEMSLDQYKQEFPSAPLLSEMAKKKLAEHEATKRPVEEPVEGSVRKAFHEVFGLGRVKAAMSSSGSPIMIEVGSGEHPELIPSVDSAYVYDIENLKNILLALDCNIPILAWGHAGTGKTTLIEQVCARTQRPYLRVQHTINTEESHIVGQWVARGGETHFEYGPLPMAMINGWIYLADEYDFALPSVTAVYQAVLEGKPLMIKDAPPSMRIVKPHPNFRFIATGNTNGSGDETGLYQGTNMQNAANYDRFGMVIQVRYMKPELEVRVIMGQAGIEEADAKKLVDFANRVREQFDGNKVSSPISPRTLINAAMIGARRASFRTGVTLSFINKLPTVDREVIDGLAQRVFG